MRIFPKLKKLKLKKVPSFVVVVDVYKQKFNNENFVCLIKNCMRSIERILTKYKRVMERGRGSYSTTEINHSNDIENINKIYTNPSPPLQEM